MRQHIVSSGANLWFHKGYRYSRALTPVSLTPATPSEALQSSLVHFFRRSMPAFVHPLLHVFSVGFIHLPRCRGHNNSSQHSVETALSLNQSGWSGLPVDASAAFPMCWHSPLTGLTLSLRLSHPHPILPCHAHSPLSLPQHALPPPPRRGPLCCLLPTCCSPSPLLPSNFQPST